MADSTEEAKMDEMMTLLKETTKTHGKILQDLMQQISMLGSKMESMFVRLEPKENSWVSPIRETPVGSTSNLDQPPSFRVARLEFFCFNEIDPSSWLY